MTDFDVAQLLATARESTRLDALRDLDVLDSPPEDAFDDLAWLASAVCEAPIALVSLVDSERQWFKARHGLDACETPRDQSFCAHAIENPGLFEIADATLDPRFADNPLVTGAPHIRFYAGAPLVGRHGHCYGTLCVIDTAPRSLTDEQKSGLLRLARRASDALETRRLHRKAEAREATLSQLLEAMPDGVVTCDQTGMLGEFNETARQWHGTDPRALPPEEWAEHFDLYSADGNALLPTNEIPLLRALHGEHVREAEITIRAIGQPPRVVRCNAEPLRASDGALLGAVCVMHDVTRLKAAEESARLESQRFSEAFAAAAQGMALVSLEGRWLEVNDAVCDMFGYSRDELLALDFQRLTHPEDLQSDLKQVTELLTGKHLRYQLEKRYFHKTGRVIHAHLSVSLVRDGQGKPLHFVSQIQDFTQRYQSERRLRESEQKFRSVLENTHDAFVASDDTGCIMEWNHAAEVTFGWRRSEVLGKPLDDLIVPPRMREAHRAGMARFLRTGDSHVLGQRLQLPAWHRAGHEFPIEITISMVHIGSQQVFSAFLHDITARTQVKEALKATAAQLRTITDNVPAPIAHVGADLRYLFVNRAYSDWYGRDADSLVGMHMSELLRPDHYRAVQPRLAEVLSGQKTSFDLDVRGLHGDIRHLHVTYIPEPQPEGTSGPPASFHLMLHDQTPQVRLARMLSQQALRDELTGLPNRAAWNDELKRAVARAQRAGTPIAVMFLDLDGFKQINDAYGHAAGDHVLKEFASVLKATLRTSDVVARLAGDEFVALLDRAGDNESDLESLAAKILQRLAGGTRFNGHELPICASIGVGVQNGPEYDADALMRCADEAMYAAKRAPDRTPQIRDCGAGTGLEVTE